MRYFVKALYLYSSSWGTFGLQNSLHNLCLTFRDFIIPFVNHGLLFSFFSLLMGHVYQEPYKKSFKSFKINIFSSQRSVYCLKVSFKGIDIEILEISEHSLIAIFCDIIFLNGFKANKLLKMIWNETCYVTRYTFPLMVIYKYIANKCCGFYVGIYLSSR